MKNHRAWIVVAGASLMLVACDALFNNEPVLVVAADSGGSADATAAPDTTGSDSGNEVGSAESDSGGMGVGTLADGGVDSTADAADSRAADAKAADAQGAPDAPDSEVLTGCSSAETPCSDGGPQPTPPSCATGGDGLTNCGDGGESCCTSLDVPEGSFYRTYTNTGSGPTGEGDVAMLSAFRLDKYLVTVGRFRQYLNYLSTPSAAFPASGSGKHAHLNGGKGLIVAGGPLDGGLDHEPGWNSSDNVNIAVTPVDILCGNANGDPYATWTRSAGSRESLPMNCVNWYDAYAFCIWDGGFLPTDAEWEYAAAGGSDQRQYPWGSTAPGSSNDYAVFGCNNTAPNGCQSVVNIAPVGTATLGAGRWGHLDMAGELYEWVLDWYAPYMSPCADCAYLAPTSAGRVEHGSAYASGLAELVPTSRGGLDPASTTGLQTRGFRCARVP